MSAGLHVLGVACECAARQQRLQVGVALRQERAKRLVRDRIRARARVRVTRVRVRVRVTRVRIGVRISGQGQGQGQG